MTSITIKRLSDNSIKQFTVQETHRVSELKKMIHADFPPHTPHGCRLISPHGKVMKSIHRLKHYKLGNNPVVTMDDSKDWSSSSSGSESDQD